MPLQPGSLEGGPHTSLGRMLQELEDAKPDTLAYWREILQDPNNFKTAMALCVKLNLNPDGEELNLIRALASSNEPIPAPETVSIQTMAAVSYVLIMADLL